MAAVNRNLFIGVRTDTKARCGLSAYLILGLGRLNHILVVFTLWLCAYQHLAAVYYDVNIGTLAVFSAGVVADNDRAVRPDNDSRAVRHADPRAPVGLRLHRVAGIKLNVTVGDYYLPRGRADHAYIALERHKAGASQRSGVQGNILERVAILPNIQRYAGADQTHDQDQHDNTHCALLNDPPINLEMADSSCHQFCLSKVKMSARGVAKPGQHRLTQDIGDVPAPYFIEFYCQ